ncbi:MAG TPA: sulfur carrier protein ThiS [Methylomirabilota bacterium]
MSLRISVNGKPMEVEAGLTVEDLLTRLAVKREYTAVAINRDVVRKADYATLTLAEGDRVEIVRPMGGGAS